MDKKYIHKKGRQKKYRPRVFRMKCKPWKKEKAREMRKNPTPSEKKLWDKIRGFQLGAKFRRQAIILGYIADFYCASKRVVVEIDGDYHKNFRDYDSQRDKAFSSISIFTLRINADLVMNDIEKALSIIKKAVQDD